MTLTLLRQEIDKIDQELVHLFEKRLALVNQVSDHKVQHNMAVFDQQREGDILEKVSQLVTDPSLESAIIETFEMIMAISRKHQTLRQNKGDAHD